MSVKAQPSSTDEAGVRRLPALNELLIALLHAKAPEEIDDAARACLRKLTAADPATAAQDVASYVMAAKERLHPAAPISDEEESRRTAELLKRVAPLLAAELDIKNLSQTVVDLAAQLLGAESGSFYQNPVDELSISTHGMVRCDDVAQDPRYRDALPFHATSKGNFPVRSFLKTPVVSRSGETLGGLFFGHSSPGRFTAIHEELIRVLASQAGIAMDNARLFEQQQWSQAELKRSNEELRRANQDLETFAYSASHDLQEPLRTMSLSAQLLEQMCADRLPADALKFLGNISQGARRMESLIHDLLAYTMATKYAEGQPPLIDSGAVLANVMENLKLRIAQEDAQVTCDSPLPLVSMHESRLVQLLQNIIGNALKYRGKEAPRVHISAVEREGWFVFSVADNGIGIDARYGNQIFGLFKRLHSRDEFPGSGIGLAICQRIVEQYGGRIWLETSVPGRGSTFCFSISARQRSF